MPELPEVETVRRVLEPQLAGAVIDSVCVRDPKVIAHPDAEALKESAKGRRIETLSRRGKFLIATLDDGSRIAVHLRMTGCLLITPSGYPEEKHTHIVFHLADGRELRFSDTRRFGRLWLIRKDEEDRFTGISRLGPEPDDPIISGEYLSKKLGGKRKAIKECLLDQAVVAGIGNIYSDEILFAARIAPTRHAYTLSMDEWERLARAIPERIAFFTETNRISQEDYLRTKGKDYRNTPYIRIYGREGEPCPKCGALLRRTVIAGRGSTYCPSCQGAEDTQRE